MSVFKALGGQNPFKAVRYERRKLNADLVEKIRQEYAQDPRPTQAALGIRFGVSQPQISRIVRGRQWRKDPRDAAVEQND